MNDTYLITGASSDLAIAYLKMLSDRGDNCTALCQYHTHHDALDDLIKQSDCLNIVTYSVDLSNSDMTEKWIREIEASGYEPNHILHAAAEPFSYMYIKDFNWEKTLKQLTIQVNSFGQIMKAFLPKMSKQKYGKVVAILSAGILGVAPRYMSDYIIAKQALYGLVKSTAVEYAEKGININAISPNMMETKFLKNLEPRQVDIAAKGTTLKRNVRVEEVVKTIDYLMSDASDYMTGVNINITGGDSM